MASEFVAPIRYEEEPLSEASPRSNVGFKRWLVVGAILFVSWYMNSIGAVAYSILLFLVAVGMIVALTLFRLVTRPRNKDADNMRENRRNLLKRWRE